VFENTDYKLEEGLFKVVPGIAIRKEVWKLLHYFKLDRKELFNLKKILQKLITSLKKIQKSLLNS